MKRIHSQLLTRAPPEGKSDRHSVNQPQLCGTFTCPASTRLEPLLRPSASVDMGAALTDNTPCPTGQSWRESSEGALIN